MQSSISVFENISLRVAEEISRANKSLYIAVAWFTHPNIYEAVVKRAAQGCEVALVYSNDEINRKSPIDFEILKALGGAVFPVGNGQSDLMHNKFCVIDEMTVITGSFNWSKKADINHENILITHNTPEVAAQYIAQFRRIVNRYYPNHYGAVCTSSDIGEVMKCLERIKLYIQAEETDSINAELKTLRSHTAIEGLEDVIVVIEGWNEHDRTNSVIDDFISNHSALSIWEDEDVEFLKLEIKMLEGQVFVLEQEHMELEKVITDYQRKYQDSLGDIILEILEIRVSLYEKGIPEAHEAKEDEEQYRYNLSEEQEKEFYKLTADEAKELRKKFRAATMLCHPDKFTNEPSHIQQEVEAIFQELKIAYEMNDIDSVTEILGNLRKGNIKAKYGSTILKRGQLNLNIKKMRKKLNGLHWDIHNTKTNDLFMQIEGIEDFDVYLENEKSQLLAHLEELKTKLSAKSAKA